MPWKGVTVSIKRQRFLEDHKLNYDSVTELAERFGISRKTAYEGFRLARAPIRQRLVQSQIPL